jgi:hypothetical protein
MKPAHMAVFLQLCLLAGIAAAQTPEQELQAEAQKLFPTVFTKCGEDYFSKRIFKFKSGTAYVISQYKELAAGVKSYPLSKPDALNGIQWKGVIQFTASAARDFPHGEQFLKQGLNPRQLDVWNEWKAPQMGPYTYPLQKKNGVVTITRRPPMEITPIKCSEVPKG